MEESVWKRVCGSERWERVWVGERGTGRARDRESVGESVGELWRERVWESFGEKAWERECGRESVLFIISDLKGQRRA